MAHEYERPVTCIGESARAAHVRREDGCNFWVPKSVIDDDSEVYKEGAEGKLVVADWFAEKECWE